MTDDKPITIEDLRARVEQIELDRVKPKPIRAWLVMSWYAPGGFWKLWPEMHADKTQAGYATTRLPKGHTHAVIVEVVHP